ncbi:hypothetical protein Gotur_009481 [Gossypium turneri]
METKGCAVEYTMEILPYGTSGRFFAGDLFQWLKSNLQSVAKSVVGEDLISIAQVSENWISLCTNGAAQVVSGNAAVGGVIKNGNGEWIMGYNKYLGE